MTELLVVKQKISNFFSKYEVYLKPVGKLILALIVFATINSKLGYMEKLDNPGIVLIAALMCSFMPMNFIVLLAAVFVVLHVYALLLEAAVVVLVLFLVLFLVYFRLSPKDTIVVCLTPILCGLNIPYILPVAMGLIVGPASAASIGCGVIVYFVLNIVTGGELNLSSSATEDMANNFRTIIDAILDCKGMILLIVAFAITVIVVYCIKLLPIKYSWSIAIVLGAILDAFIVLIGNATLDSGIGAAGVFVGSILAVIVGFIIQFLLFNVDYNRTENLQFSDDQYVYYVKAIPRNVAPTKKSAKSGNRPAPNRNQVRRAVNPASAPEDEE